MTQIEIGQSEIHLWQAEQADFALSELQRGCLDWLTAAERARHQRYQFDRHRRQLLLSRTLLRTALSSYDKSVAPESWDFTYNEYGKPAISPQQNHSSLYFNLSHSADRVVLAVSRFEAIGVDIEYARKTRRIAAIAERYFSDQEAAALLALPADRQLSRFYELWTMKEAYIKACGMGLAIPLQHFSYGFESDKSISLAFDSRRRDDASAWQLWQLSAGSDFKLALAAKAEASVPPHELSAWRLAGLGRIVKREIQVERANKMAR